MNKLLKKIKTDPLAYLPEKSLSALNFFRLGYYHRGNMERMEFEPLKLAEFEQWLYQHFSMESGVFGPFQIVLSYSQGEEDAFDNFFNLFEEFEKSGFETKPSPISAQLPKNDLVPLIREIRKRPELYVGYPSFSGVSGYLAGNLQAGKDLGLPMTADEELFSRFKQWVEANKNRAQAHRPWYKIISFYSGTCDCGHITGGAYSVFLKWLDEFASEIGRPDIFV